MRKWTGARVLLVAGFLSASFGYGGWVALHTVLDPAATHTVARNVVATPLVQKNLATQLQTEVDKELQDAHASVEVKRAVDQAVRDPRVAAAFADAVADVQRAVLADSPQTITIDAPSLTSAVHDALVRTDPALAAQFAAQSPLSATIDANKVPHLGRVHQAADTALVLGLLAALLLVGASLAIDHSRRAVARAGRRLAYLSITPIVAFQLLPRVLGTSGTSGVARVALDSYAPQVVPSAITILIAGATVVLVSLLLPRPTVAADPEPNDADSFMPGRPVFTPPAAPVASTAPPRLGETLRL